MSHTRWDYARLMRERGFRVTPQRQLILDAICAAGGHTSFDEIFARVQQTSSAVNRATVYRALDFLCELRLVVGADMGSGHMVYEIAGDTPHHHLVCRACGAQQDVSHKDIKGLFTRFEREHAFRVDLDHVALPGLCQACYAAECQAGRQPAQRPPAAHPSGPAARTKARTNTPRKPRHV
jgi:Fur family transcriptional regulator, ferric uptake regulator